MNSEWRTRYDLAVEAARTAGDSAVTITTRPSRSSARPTRARSPSPTRGRGADPPNRGGFPRTVSSARNLATSRGPAVPLDHRPDRRHQIVRPPHPDLGNADRPGIQGRADCPASRHSRFRHDYRALRGDGASERPAGPRLDGRDPGRIAPLLLQYRLVHASRPEKTFLELASRTARQRGFGDFYGFVLVAEGAADLMLEHGVNPVGHRGDEGHHRGGGRQLHRLGRLPTIDRAGRSGQQRPGPCRGAGHPQAGLNLCQMSTDPKE